MQTHKIYTFKISVQLYILSSCEFIDVHHTIPITDTMQYNMRMYRMFYIYLLSLREDGRDNGNRIGFIMMQWHCRMYLCVWKKNKKRRRNEAKQQKMCDSNRCDRAMSNKIEKYLITLR